MASRQAWLCLPPTVFALFDYAMTLWGQPAHYWAGDHSAAFEANPVVHWFMTVHPFALHALTLVWLGAFCGLILKLPRFPARLLSLSITFSHAFCAGTWLFPLALGFYYALALCITSALLFVSAVELSAPAKPAPN